MSCSEIRDLFTLGKLAFLKMVTVYEYFQSFVYRGVCDVMVHLFTFEGQAPNVSTCAVSIFTGVTVVCMVMQCACAVNMCSAWFALHCRAISIA